MVRPNPRHSHDSLELATVVPGGPAASPACRNGQHRTHRSMCTCGRRGRRPSKEPATFPRFARTREDCPWRACGLVGLSQRATSPTSKHVYLRPARPPALQRTRDIPMIRPNPRGLSLEGRRPRRLVATGNIARIEACVPAAGEAAGPPKNPRHSHDSPEPARIVPGGPPALQRTRDIPTIRPNPRRSSLEIRRPSNDPATSA
jgi:hypothetical protein